MKNIVCAALICLATILTAQEEIGSFFNYPPEELKHLEQLASQNKLDGMELRKWDALAAQAIEVKNIDFYDYTRIFTYLYVAQSEAATLSRNFVGELRGSLDPISYQVLSLFLPNLKKPDLYIEDPYSQAIAKLVLPKIKERVDQENAQKTSFSVPKELRKDFSAGLQVAKWMPWFAKPSTDYWPPAPPDANSPIWKEQIKLIKQAQTPMTEEKKEVVYRWAGLSYPWSSDLRTIANEYMHCHNTPLSKMIAARVTLMVGLYDCVAAYITCKYQYLRIRPQVYDPTVYYVIPSPKHPSYPAGHATEVTVASKVLAFFFPTDAGYWNQLGVECSNSRIWAGIHYPIDNEAGKTCGTKVANTVLSEIFKKNE